MDSGIIISFVLGSASIISSICFGLIPNIRKSKLENLEKKVLIMAQDIDSFYAIEQSLLEELSCITGKSKETLKRETRKNVKVEKGRPLSNYSTPSGISSELQKL